MIRAKKTKLLRYKTLYAKRVFPFLKLTPDVGDAKNYYPFAIMVRLFCLVYYAKSFRVVNGVSISGNFDSRMEVETGGIRGFIGKLLLKFLRLLDELKEKIE